MNANNAIELCAGYGGLHMGLAAVTGAQLTHVSEIDDGASAILAHHHPSVPNLGDLKAINWDDVPDLPTRLRWLLAGYPCQPFSDAGRKLGAADPRHLWPWVAASVAALNPDFVLFENVRGHVRRGLPEVLDTLTLLGYVTAWTVVRASDVGAPHQRARVFILGVRAELAGTAPRSLEVPRTEHAAPSGLLPTPMARDTKGRTVQQREGTLGLPSVALLLPTPQANLGSNGGAQAPEKRRAGGHSVSLADVAEFGLPSVARGVGSSTPRATDGTNGGPNQRGRRGDLAMPSVVHVEPERWAQYAPAVARWSHILGRPAPEPLEAGHRGGRRLNRLLPEWMMGLPSGHVTDVPGLSYNAMLKALGNGVVWLQAAYAVGILLRALSLASSEMEVSV